MATDYGYPLDRNAPASARLNLQHYLWVASTGYMLHPSIRVPEGGLVADVGTGTGIFSLELARTLPAGARIEAVDISLAQTPAATWWPANVQFSQLDALSSEVPAALRGRFDVVHVRLFMCVVAGGDPGPLLRNLLALLKPGGHLQWQEYDSACDRVLTAAGGGFAQDAAAAAAAAPKLAALLALGHAQGIDLAWTSSLHDRFPAHGAELVALERHHVPDSHRVVQQDLLFMAVREWAGRVVDKDPAAAQNMLKLCAEAEQECWASQRGVVVDSEMVTWVAKKL